LQAGVFIADLVCRQELLLVVVGQIDVFAFKSLEVVVEAEDADFETLDDLRARLLADLGRLPFALQSSVLPKVHLIWREAVRRKILVAFVICVRLGCVEVAALHGWFDARRARRSRAKHLRLDNRRNVLTSVPFQ